MKSNQPIALITGATDGIGKEVALQLASRGSIVILGARNLEKGEKVVEEFRRKGVEVDFVYLDVTNEKSIISASLDIGYKYGRLDILVNNAGIGIDTGPLSQLPFENLKKTFETNVFGTFLVTQHMLTLLRKSEYARIVNVSSGLASLLNMTDENSPYYNIVLPSYASSKAALNVLTIHFARELKSEGIKVNAVEPGLTATRNISIPGAQPVEIGAEAIVRYAMIDTNGPTGGFFDRNGSHNW
ncbi:SDR family oxidoreductase [Citrobacter koseri]|uniref:SDR family oxidoreductase n=1 Tax=Citrobacter koseri TaxID=545 RepID=UPI0023B1D936|nr:SDR family oxidoreductase [Citrobacter koseri]